MTIKEKQKFLSFSIGHLNDDERMFFVTLLLKQIYRMDA